MKKLLTAIFCVAIVITMTVVSCNKDASHNSSDSPENIINGLFAIKADYIMHFEERDKLFMPEVFNSEELKNAVRYKFLDYAELGHVTQYSHTFKIASDEIVDLGNGGIILPVVETTKSTSLDPTSEPAGPATSEYAEKLFFFFEKQKGEWKITKIQLLSDEHEVDTKYSAEFVIPFNLTNTEMAQAATANEESRIKYEERKIWEAFFDKKIDITTFDRQIHDLYEINNLLPVAETRSQSISRNRVVSYATRWTSTSSGTSSYNNILYKCFHSSRDCANFASQSLYYGGLNFENAYSSSSSYSSWWYKNRNTSNTSDDIPSDTWVNANALCNFLCERNNYASYTTATQVKAGRVGIADLLWIPKNGVKTHVMIVTYKSHPTSSTTAIKYSAHTSNRLNKLWTSYSSSENVIFGHF